MSAKRTHGTRSNRREGRATGTPARRASGRSHTKKSHARRSTAETSTSKTSTSKTSTSKTSTSRRSTSRRSTARNSAAARRGAAARREERPPLARRQQEPAPAPRRRSERARRRREQRNISAPPPRRSRRAGKPRIRLIAALLGIAVMLSVIVARVAQLQTAEAQELRSAGTDQWTRSIPLPAQRGTVFDRHGNELALSVPAATISINPKLIENGPATIALLDDLLDLDDDEVVELLDEVQRKELGFVYVRRQADAAIGDQIASLRLAGVNVDREGRREMPGGDTGRSVVGRTNIDGVGISGLELQYDDVLTGTGGMMRREVAPGGRSIPGSDTVVETPVAGHDLVLTLDRSIQFSTERVLLEQVQRIGARGATAIAMDPSTGEIFSLASVRMDDDTGQYEVTNGNFALVDSYEPGSVAKVITIASALSEGTVTPTDGFEVPWRKQYYDDLLKNSFQHPTQWMTIEQILVSSHNIGTIFIQETMGRWVHRDYMAAFGLGERSALDFPGESPGILKEADDLWGSERVTVAYGQGVSSTSLQLVGAVNVIANDGVYVEPKLVRSTVGPDGEMSEAPASVNRTVVTPEAADQTTAMMQQVVCRGTAKLAKVEGVPIAGKTGTAFKAAPNGTYYDDEGNRIYYSSFVGFFPADDPQVTVLISVDEPPAGTQDRFGGTAAAPVFAELAPTLINELGIRPPPGGDGCGPEGG